MQLSGVDVNQKLNAYRKRFALVEVMLTAAVLAIIAVLIIPFLSKANQKGRYTSWSNQKKSILSDVDLSVYYDFTDGEGRIVRNSAIGAHVQDYDPIDHDARLSTGVSWRTGRWQAKPALALDGESGFLSANAEFSKKSLTFIMWFKAESADGGLLMTSKSRKLDSASDLRLQIKKGFVQSSIAKGVVASRVACKLDRWHMVAVTLGVGLSKYRLFQDGALVGESDDFAMGTKVQRSVIVGFTPGAGFFKGMIGEFMSFSRELTEAEILDIYTNTKP